MTRAWIPTLDLTPFVAGHESGRAELARELDRACRDHGFLQIVGHAIPDAVIESMLEATDAFFALPLEQKLLTRPADPAINRGYAPMGSEALSYSLGEAAPAPDQFEAFNIGPDEVPDEPFYRDAPHHFFAPNPWPGVPGMRQALTAYFDEAQRVALTLTDAFALALDLPDRWFRTYVARSTVTLRVNHYERRSGDAPAVPGQMRMGAHTDYGIVTVLYADAVPGLQVLAADGSFRDVVPEPGALLVNLGDLTARWTNDRWRSTLHRVVPPRPDAHGAARRRSAALFLDGNYDALISCLPTCVSAGAPARYPPVSAGEHLFRKIMGPRSAQRANAGAALERV